MSAYRGRFAPSPSGLLHLGSLLAAVASWLEARARHGKWLLRIEDIDPPREVPGAAAKIIAELAAYGLEPDEPVLWQSTRRAAHDAALAALLDSGLAFPCACSRADLEPGGVYPGTCRRGLPPGRAARSIRFKVSGQIAFDDRCHGRIEQDLDRDCGDFVIRRADGWPAYQLAVVVDDAAQGITDIVRGADLLSSTARQIALQQALRLPSPTYLHLPLVRGADGRKLSKRLGSDPLAGSDRRSALRAVLTLLGQPPPPAIATLDGLWAYALKHWNPGAIPRGIQPAAADAILLAEDD